jgi:hypothetical protein
VPLEAKADGPSVQSRYGREYARHARNSGRERLHRARGVGEALDDTEARDVALEVADLAHLDRG